MSEHTVTLTTRLDYKFNKDHATLWVRSAGLRVLIQHAHCNALGPEERDAYCNTEWVTYPIHAGVGGERSILLDGLDFYITNGTTRKATGVLVRHQPANDGACWVFKNDLSYALYRLCLRSETLGDYDKRDIYSDLRDIINAHTDTLTFHNGNTLRVSWQDET